jgi:uncharacterized protein involved in type VI secretion and phage assembly
VVAALHMPRGIEIRLDGQALPERALGSVVAVLVQQHLSQPSACELSLVGPDAAALAPRPAPGQSLRLSQTGATAAWFEGQVTALEHVHAADGRYTLVVRAYDALFVLRQRQRARVHVDITLPELARELVADLGLSVQAEAPGPVWPRVVQTGSDFDLLADLAGRCGLYLHVHAGVLQLLSAQGAGDPVDLGLHDHLLEAAVEHNDHGTCARVQAHGWNPWRGAAWQAQAGEGSAGAVPGDAVRLLLGLAAQDIAGVEAAAQAELDARRGVARVLRATARGDVRLRPGVRVRVTGLLPGVETAFVLASVRHTLDAQRGFLSELSSELPATRLRAPSLAMTPGRVTQVDDPERLGRIKVALPAYAELESDWLQWMAPGAGRAKGLVAPPDIGDLMVVLLDPSDPAQAVVIGSLWGESGLPEGFSFLSPGGQRVHLDDAAQRLRLESADGSCLELAPGRTLLQSSGPMTLEAPGQRLTIRAQFIDFERT